MSDLLLLLQILTNILSKDMVSAIRLSGKVVFFLVPIMIFGQLQTNMILFRRYRNVQRCWSSVVWTRHRYTVDDQRIDEVSIVVRSVFQSGGSVLRNVSRKSVSNGRQDIGKRTGISYAGSGWRVSVMISL